MNLPKDPEAPEYKIGRNSHSPKEATDLLLFISILPQYFTPEHISALGRQLNRDFCKEKRIRAIIVDDYRAATIWEPIHLAEFYAPAERGLYFLDRTAGTEYVEFSTMRGRGSDIFINLTSSANQVEHRIHAGQYRNENFGYSTKIPIGLSGVSAVPKELEHGVEITLTSEPQHYIWLGGADNTAGYNSAGAAVNAQLTWLQDEGMKLLATTRTVVHLDGLRAIRTTVRYKPPDSNVVKVQTVVIALKPAQDEYGTIYMIEMRTTEPAFRSDKKIFDQIIRSWRWHRSVR